MAGKATRGGSLTWLKRVERDNPPLYRAIASALEEAVRAGELQPGERLAPQRAVARSLGVDLTTVTRAYNAAHAAGLLDGTVGRGSFVRAPAAPDDAGLVDLTMNLPPPPLGLSLGALIGQTCSTILARVDAAALMAYHPDAGSSAQRAAGAAWLAPVLGEVSPDQLLVAAGAQAALAAALSVLCRPGDAVLTEPLIYPGLRAAAAQLGLRLVACAADAEGMTPDALDAACRAHGPSALYLTPAMQNPTATTMSVARRRAVARLAAAHDVRIIEDDPYSLLMARPLPALATFAPDRTIHVATLSKVLTPGLRIAFVVAPAALAERVAAALRAVSQMPAPLMAALAAAWIRDGTAETVLAAIRREAVARRALAAAALPDAVGAPESLHVWQPLPSSSYADRLRLAARERGLALAAADAFAVGPDFAPGLRISLGGPTRRASLARALQELGETLRGGTAAPAVIV